MQFTQQVQVLGLKRSKGVIADSGQSYDSTKAYLVLPVDNTKGDALGASAEAFNIGLSDQFDAWKGTRFPCTTSADFELVTTGNTPKLVVKRLHLPAAAPVKG